MNVLWFAFGIYILGISAVLFLRPSLMFDGSAWKEFGLSHKGNYTIFPFWMFIVVWSVFSYVLGSFCVIGFSSVSAPGSAAATAANDATAATAAAANDNIIEEAILEKEEPRLEVKELPLVEEDKPISRPRRRGGKKPVPGYYVRGIVKGKPKYVYYGTESPFDE